MPFVFDCADAGSVMALTKHVTPRTYSAVTYADLARTIDGSDGSTEDPSYKTPEYIAADMKPADIIVKLVRDPSAG
ncbi:hypothetical protein COL154_007009 [Colletotrichum chrysophilum]|nr:hypothetical protein COL154_007009 [Colletotrichum chrysophilum]